MKKGNNFETVLLALFIPLPVIDLFSGFGGMNRGGDARCAARYPAGVPFACFGYSIANGTDSFCHCGKTFLKMPPFLFLRTRRNSGGFCAATDGTRPPCRQTQLSAKRAYSLRNTGATARRRAVLRKFIRLGSCAPRAFVRGAGCFPQMQKRHPIFGCLKLDAATTYPPGG